MTRKLSVDAGNGIGRRPFLKTVGLGVAGTALMAGSVAAHPKPTKTHELHWGDSVSVGDGEVSAYATTNPAGKLSSLGVNIDADALAVFDTDETPPHEKVEAHLAFPSDVDTHQFTFVGFHFNPQGHPPAGIYTVPHFDFHFYMMEEDDVEAIPFGPATYSIPTAQMPEDYSRVPVVDLTGDGVPDPIVEDEMGEHLVDLSSPEFQPDGEFTHTMIYGAYDPDGDGVGRLTFVEPMITNAFLDDLTEKLEVEMKVPDEYFTADDYPTQYVVEPSSHGGVYISVDGFEEFPGPSA